ncbi:MAG: hypothetical protein MUQ10_13155, partial [Anaerolineae bacterium]|nr:hypothetical protein [Anaerolineae bacterium]
HRRIHGCRYPQRELDRQCPSCIVLLRRGQEGDYRPIPDAEAWFETAWAEFRSGAIFDHNYGHEHRE